MINHPRAPSGLSVNVGKGHLGGGLVGEVCVGGRAGTGKKAGMNWWYIKKINNNNKKNSAVGLFRPVGRGFQQR